MFRFSVTDIKVKRYMKILIWLPWLVVNKERADVCDAMRKRRKSTEQHEDCFIVLVVCVFTVCARG